MAARAGDAERPGGPGRRAPAWSRARMSMEAAALTAGREIEVTRDRRAVTPSRRDTGPGRRGGGGRLGSGRTARAQEHAGDEHEHAGDEYG